jgi:FdhE protein
VGTNFLRKLIGRPPELSAEVRDALEELDRLARERPALAGPAQFLADALPGLYAEPVSVSSLLTQEQALPKWDQGIPLLRGETLPLDAAAVARRWQHLCSAAQRRQENPAAKAVADVQRRGALDVGQLTQGILSAQPEVVHAQAAALGLDAGLTATILRLTLFPVLSSINETTAPWRTGRAWKYGYCPTCGSWPLLGEFRGLEQTRFLRCGFCAASWEFPRLRCPFCHTADHRQLGYFYIETEESKYRAATCDTCRGYVKMISSLAELPPARLLVADLATMHLDLVAAERGFAPPTYASELKSEPDA